MTDDSGVFKRGGEVADEDPARPHIYAAGPDAHTLGDGRLALAGVPDHPLDFGVVRSGACLVDLFLDAADRFILRSILPIRFSPPPGKRPIIGDDPGDQTSSTDL